MGQERITRVAAYALVRRDDGAVLLARASRGSDVPGSWWLPGGGLDFGEAPAAAAERETAEETGIAITVTGDPEVHSEVTSAPDGTHVHHVRLVYRGTPVGGELAAEQAGSTDMAAWLPMERALALPLAAWLRPVLDRADVLGV